MTSVKFLVLSIWNAVKTEIPIFVSEWVWLHWLKQQISCAGDEEIESQTNTCSDGWNNSSCDLCTSQYRPYCAVTSSCLELLYRPLQVQPKEFLMSLLG